MNMAGSRLPQDEYDRRVKECYTLRFENKEPFGIKHWLEYCKKHYDDKSQQQHTKMWSDAGDMYQDAWKAKLNNMLGPATDRIYELLASDNPNDQKEAIKMVYKYTGNEVEKIDSNVKQETVIKVNFGR